MKTVYLLDTNVVSELIKKSPNQNLIGRIAENNGICAISSTIWQEVVFGFEVLPEGKRKETIRIYMERIKKTFDVIPYDAFASEICGQIRARCKKAGHLAPFYDSQIAATAIANNMILVTHNTKDFESIAENSMLQLEDWWE